MISAYIGIAVAVMVIATTACHLGLPQEVAKVLCKIMRCHKCLSFWTSLAVLFLTGCPLLIAVPLSMMSAYLSNWYAVLLVLLNRLYDKLWQRINRNK